MRYLFGLLVAIIVSLSASAVAAAQTPSPTATQTTVPTPTAPPSVSTQSPDDRWPCVDQVNFDSLVDNPSLNLDPGLALATRTVPANTGPVDEVQLTWALPNVASLKCVWVGVQLPGTSYFMAQYILRPGEAADMRSLTIRPAGNAGTYCFRLVAMTATEKGAFADRCAQIVNVRVPAGPQDGPFPPDTGTGTSSSHSTVVGVIGEAMAAVGGVGIAVLSTKRLRGRRSEGGRKR